MLENTGMSLRTTAAFDLRRPGAAVTRPSKPPTGPARIDVEQATDSGLVELISDGSVPAFVALFDRTSAAVRTELPAALPGTTRPGEIFAASYVEVWWLAGCHRLAEADVTAWIIGILRRRIAEASREMPPGAEQTV
jgi:hypothetical protein